MMRTVFIGVLIAGAAVSQAQVNLGLNMLPGHTTLQTIFSGQTYNGWTNTSSVDIEFVPDTIWDTHEGTGAVDLNGVSGPGAISQTFATVAGQAYQIDFWYSGNPGVNLNTGGPKSFNVLWNGGVVDSYVFTHQAGDSWQNMRWFQGSVTVLATGSSSTLTFQGTNTNHSAAGAAIDDVSLTPVPEPTTMAALGLGAFALVRRRRKV